MAQENAGGKAGTTGLLWFRGGLRLEDNTCVYHALRENTRVACLYTFDDHYLRDAIEAQGGKFLVRMTSDVPTEVVRVAKEMGAGRIYANRDYLPYPIQRDKKVAELAQTEGVALRLYDDALLVDPAVVLTEEERPYTVFSPFKRQWEGKLNTLGRYDIEPYLEHFNFAPNVGSDELPTLQKYGLTLRQQIEPGGAKRAYARLNEFVMEGLTHYHQNRDNAADPNSTSRLSMHIKWGTVSIRDCYRAGCAEGGPGGDKWIDEMAWRVFLRPSVPFPPRPAGPDVG